MSEASHRRVAVVLGLASCLAFGCRSSSATHGYDAVPAGSSPRQDAAPVRIERGRVLVPGGRAFDVEVVQDPVSRARGLQHRARLAPDRGMVFVFPFAAPHRFWMSECLIPLDIIWMDANRTVIHVEENVPFCTAKPCPDYGPEGDALYVLELGAGIARQAGIRPGAHLTLLFDHPPNPQ